MQDQELQQLINDAVSARKQKNFTLAAKLYDQAFDALIKEATEYARKQSDTVIDEGTASKILPAYFAYADGYLKRDKIACTVANNLGVALADMGDKTNARKMLLEAIRLTPEGFDYQEPYINLKSIE